MTRQLNIEKMKLDAAKAIRDILSVTYWYDCLPDIDLQVLRAIQRNEIRHIPLEELHNILGRLTP
jgi:hypothetical protein